MFQLNFTTERKAPLTIHETRAHVRTCERARAGDSQCVPLTVYYGTGENYERTACGRRGSRAVQGNMRVAAGNERQARKLGRARVS